MGMSTVRLIPGVDTEKTFVLNEAGISTSAFIRFRDGLVEKLGGWVRFVSYALTGRPRQLHAWQDLNETSHLAVGTTEQLVVITNGQSADITPQELVSDFAPNFSTTLGSNEVEITDPNINTVTVNDSIFLNTPISIGGLILSGLYPISVVTGATTYKILAGSNATATATGGAVPEFTTASGSASVSVNFADHGLSVGNRVAFNVPTSVGGVTVFGSSVVNTVSSPSQFTITANTSATSIDTQDMNGGDAQIVYHIALGPPVAGVGYGIGDYGEGDYGLGVVQPEQSGDPITATGWSMDNWGEILIAAPTNGGIYAWSPTGGFENAQMIATAPAFNGGVFVSMPAQILVAWGCSDAQSIGVDQDPLLVRWSDQLDYSAWTVSTTSAAGFHRIPNGSRIMGAMQGPQYGLIWTDLDLWSMNYIGQNGFTFGFNKIGTSCGLVSANSMTQLGSTIFWMGRSNFFALTSGGATALPCKVWDAVFQNLDTNNLDKCWCWANTPFNEVWWFYPSASSSDGECDSYVKVNVVEGAWDYGPLRRSCGIDQSVLGMPIAAGPNGVIYQHEMGYDNAGSPINATFRTGYFAIADGDQIPFVDWWIPDMRWNTFSNSQTPAQIQVTFYSIMYPGDTNVRTYGPYTLTNSTKFINPRIRGRFVALEISSNDLGSFWRIGLNRFRVAQDGRQ